MTRTSQLKRRQPTSPSPPRSGNSSDGTAVPKPYELIAFPQERPRLQRPAGHHKFHADRLHGTLFLTLKVQTSLHVSTGVVVMGSDIGSRVSLIKTMVQGVDQKLSIQGSSLKGCIRSVYEAITNSTLAVITSKYREKIPRERLPCKNKEELCPASQVFGALDWQGLIDFSDAQCESASFTTGFMPSLHAPQPEPTNKDTRQKFLNPHYFGNDGKVRGRKFYYQFKQAVDKGQKQGISVQQAAKEYTFTTQLHFRNLQISELGTLLVVLGQDPRYPIALKVGGGKPIGMGTMTVNVTEISAFVGNQQRASEFDLPMLSKRYSSYTSFELDALTGTSLQHFVQQTIQSAHSELIQKPQLDQLTEVLRYPTELQPQPDTY